MYLKKLSFSSNSLSCGIIYAHLDFPYYIFLLLAFGSVKYVGMHVLRQTRLI